MIKVLALICATHAPDRCMWKTVTSSDFADLTMTGCMVGAPAIAKWMAGYPGYQLKRWACQIGARPQKEPA